MYWSGGKGFVDYENNDNFGLTKTFFKKKKNIQGKNSKSEKMMKKNWLSNKKPKKISKKSR